jgi:probable rRNA maturation factor
VNKILISIEDSKNRFNPSLVENFSGMVLEKIGIDGWEISLLFCSDDQIAEYNREFRKKECPTDVLSFSQEGFIEKNNEQMYYAGDIVISMDSVKRNAHEYNVSENEELKRVLIHGILHLNGHTHESANSEEPMIVLQEKLLGSLQGVELF